MFHSHITFVFSHLPTCIRQLCCVVLCTGTLRAGMLPAVLPEIKTDVFKTMGDAAEVEKMLPPAPPVVGRCRLTLSNLR